MRNFSANLKNLMNGKTESEVAEAAGISQQAISDYLLCKREISLENLCKLADYFDEDIDYLLGRKI